MSLAALRQRSEQNLAVMREAEKHVPQTWQVACT
jgi:hypothetical protein